MKHYTISDYAAAIEQAKTMRIPRGREIGGLITRTGLVELPNRGNPRREYIPRFSYSQQHLYIVGNRAPYLGIWHTHYTRPIPPSQRDHMHLRFVLRCGGDAIMVVNPHHIYLLHSGGQEVFSR